MIVLVVRADKKARIIFLCLYVGNVNKNKCQQIIQGSALEQYKSVVLNCCPICF